MGLKSETQGFAMQEKEAEHDEGHERPDATAFLRLWRDHRVKGLISNNTGADKEDSKSAVHPAKTQGKENQEVDRQAKSIVSRGGRALDLCERP